MDWTNVYLENAELPWHLWENVRQTCPEYDKNLDQSVVDEVLSDPKSDGCIIWDFWQNQNTWVDLSEVTSVMYDALGLAGYHINMDFPVTRWHVIPGELSLISVKSNLYQNENQKLSKHCMVAFEDKVIIGSCSRTASKGLPLIMESSKIWVSFIYIITSILFKTINYKKYL